MKYHSCLQPAIRLCRLSGWPSFHSIPCYQRQVSSSKSESSQDEADGTEEDDNAEEDKGGIETSSDGQVASDGEEQQEHPHAQDTLTSISQVFGKHEDTDPESDPAEKVQSIWRKWHPKTLRRTAP